MSRTMRFLQVGPGGRKCSCCFQPPGPSRKAQVRRAKRLEAKLALRVELETQAELLAELKAQAEDEEEFQALQDAWDHKEFLQQSAYDTDWSYSLS